MTTPDVRAFYTTLGIAEASDVLGLTGAQTAIWQGQTVDATSVLIKYTYGGDANLDGVVDILDYGQIDGSINLAHQPLEMVPVERRGERHLFVRRFDTPAGKDKLSGHETMPLVAAAEQHFRHGLRAIDQDQRRRIARLDVRIVQIANDAA